MPLFRSRQMFHVSLFCKKIVSIVDISSLPVCLYEWTLRTCDMAFIYQDRSMP